MRPKGPSNSIVYTLGVQIPIKYLLSWYKGLGGVFLSVLSCFGV